MAEIALTCAGCALLCDDVTATHDGGEVTLSPECALGARWLASRLAAAGEPAATIGGEPAALDAAFARAVQLLQGARRPLVRGFASATIDDARAAVSLADRIGALVAAGADGGPWPGAPAEPLRGSSTTTLGEIRDRSRLVVVWREDPERTHPRLLERLGFDAGAAGRGERVLAVIDDRDTATAARADLRLRWPAVRDLDALAALRLAWRGDPLPERPEGLAQLWSAVGDAPHLTLVHGPGLDAGSGGQRRALELHELVRDLSHDRHAVSLGLPASAGAPSAADVLTWQTGYAPTVDLACGHPELVAATGPVIDHERVDVALSVQDAGAPAGGAGVSEIALGAVAPDHPVAVSIRTAAAGVGAAGVAHRLDGVPLGLRAPVQADVPTAAAVLERLREELSGE